MTARAGSPVASAMRGIRRDWRDPRRVRIRAAVVATVAIANQPVDPHPERPIP